VSGLWLKLGRGLVAPKARDDKTRGMTTPDEIAFRRELLDVSEAPAQSRRKEQNQGDHTEISKFLFNGQTLLNISHFGVASLIRYPKKNPKRMLGAPPEVITSFRLMS
jgi:hypothetical protein